MLSWRMLVRVLALFLLVECDSLSLRFGSSRKARTTQSLTMMQQQQQEVKVPGGAKKTQSSPQKKQQHQQADPSPPPGTVVFVGNLPFTITEADVEYLLKTTLGQNKHTRIRIAMGQKTKRPLGFLFIDFKDTESAEKCVAITNGMDMWGRTLNSNIKDVDPNAAAKKRTPIRENIIFLSNLDYSLTEVEIFNMCEDLVGPGLVLEAKIPLDKSRNVPRGFAHVEFKDADSVNAAITNLNGVEVFSRILKAEKLGVPNKKAPPPPSSEAGGDRTEDLLDSLE